MTEIYNLLNILEMNYIWFSIFALGIGLIAYFITKNSIAFWIIEMGMIIIGYIENIFPEWFMVLDGFAFIVFMIYQKSPTIWRI